MLKIKFGYDADSVLDIDLFFNNVYEDEWLSDDFIKEMIKDVDNSTVIKDLLIESPVLGFIPPEKLSGGVKALICLYMCDDFCVDLIVCGKNCEKWICEIAKRRNIRATLSGYDLTFKDYDIKAVCLNDNSEINNSKDWVLKMCEFVGGTADDR